MRYGAVVLGDGLITGLSIANNRLVVRRTGSGGLEDTKGLPKSLLGGSQGVGCTECGSGIPEGERTARRV